MTDEKGNRAGLLSRATLVSRQKVSRNTHILDFEIDGTTNTPGPGQFYHVDCGGGREHLLRRPLGVHGMTAPEKGAARVRLMVEVVGWGTQRLCALEPGAEVGLMGPLGRGFTPPDGGRALLVSGGIGLAPLFFLASEMDKEGSDYDFLAGFRTGDDYYPALSDLKGNIEVFTDDGTVGAKGVVSEGAVRHIGNGDYSAVFACGPEAMMEAVADACEGSGVSCQVSLTSRMACGLGFCRSCVKEGRDGRNLCVCTEGPVFDSRDVKWNGVRS
ncbi:MAG: dihydroorotate dehydrogenase electron transfer subunit [Actinobacteria bacterium]|nr:dihydroorotate dehydrogenase electron transfer subunit [Actinomycetota bacterium]